MNFLRGPRCTSHCCPFLERVVPAPHAKTPAWRPGLCETTVCKFFTEPPSSALFDDFSGKCSTKGPGGKRPGALPKRRKGVGSTTELRARSCGSPDPHLSSMHFKSTRLSLETQGFFGSPRNRRSPKAIAVSAKMSSCATARRTCRKRSAEGTKKQEVSQNSPAG